MLEDIGPGLRVLVVDDNPQNRELIRAFLETSECEVEDVSDGEQAIGRLRSSDKPAIDAVVLDIMMPRVSGFQVLSQMKADSAMRDIPVIVVTALNETADVERAMDAGASDFLTKPVIHEELVARICAQVAVRRSARELAEARALPRG